MRVERNGPGRVIVCLACMYLAILGAAVMTLARPAQGQSASTAPPYGLANTVGLYVYPNKGQNNQQLLSDESACYSDAKSQTGVDPTAKAPAPSPDTEKGGGAKGAAKGAAAGAAVGGAVNGDPGAGAARGAAVGTIRGRRQQKKANEQAEKDAQTQAQTNQDQNLDKFKRSMSACLESKGYSVH